MPDLDTSTHDDSSAEELRRRCAEAEEAIAAKSLFLATMSHEIREPMNGVIGMTRLLLETPLSEEQRTLVDSVHDSGQALLTVINDILDLSRIEAGRLQLESIDFDLINLVERLRVLFEARAKARGLEMNVGVDPGVPRQLRGDPGRLRQVLINLLSNAIKFTKTGGVGLEVGADVDGSDVILRIQVQDTGIGIPPEVQERLFTPFVQANPSIQRVYGGSGLGLTICQRLVSLMNGWIEVESEPGCGTTFVLTVRLARSLATSTSPASGEIAGLRLLVVDANPLSSLPLNQQATQWGVDSTGSSRGEDALELLRAARGDGTPFDVALIDRSLPDMSGEELGRRIRADADLATTRLVMTASSGLRGDAARVGAIGFVGYLPKPVTADTLLACLLELRTQPSTVHRSLITVHSMSERQGAGLKILLADDNPVNCKLAALMLERAGHHVEIVANGLEAVAAVERGDYALVLMDVQMPELDGHGATQRIRALDGERRNTPIVAITANAMQGDDDLCFASGMNDYIAKPIDKARLLAKVNAWGYATASRPL